MANINSLIDCAHSINAQALQLVQKSADLIDSARNLQYEAAEVNQCMPNGLEAAMDIRADNELLGKTYQTAGVITQMNAVMDVLLGLVRGTIEDFEKINRRLGRQRRRRDQDDDIIFGVQQHQQREP